MLFQPNDAAIAASQLTHFRKYCALHLGRRFDDYGSFETFCHSDFRTFWRLFLAWAALPLGGDYEPVCVGDECETASFFPGVRLNYADIVLGGPVDAPAMRACHRDRSIETYTRGELRQSVGQMITVLRQSGVGAGDSVVAIGRNNAEMVITALAVAAIGAVFASCAHDMGPSSILARFQPLGPSVLCANLRTEPWDSGLPLSEGVAAVIAGLPSIRTVVALDDGPSPTALPLRRWWLCDETPEMVWPKHSFNTPMVVMFSSGTTGAPKCIVHGAGGTLLEHLKEHRLHCDLRFGDRLLFQTSCGWMMWNWQLSAMATGAEIVLYDGPLDSPETLWQVVADEHVTVFGTNPAYLQFCETAGIRPAAHDLTDLRSLLSTGSILYPHQFDWIIEQVKALPVQSISGGSDIIGCFVLGNPVLPVHRGEIQCRSLGMDVRSMPATGIGDLICANPFPSRPLGLIDDNERRFHETYFTQHPGVWTHGDLIEFTETGVVMHGRSDGILNIRGIRIGPAEIYHLLKDIPAVVDALAVEQQDAREPGGSRLILLVVTARPLDLALSAQIRHHLLTHGTAVMVPAQIIAVSALPTTHSGKVSETAARDVVNGRAVRNRDAIRNPAALDEIAAAMAGRGPGPVLVGPENDEVLESWLQRVCEETFKVPSIGWTDNLLDFADSLSFLNLHLEVGKALGRSLPWLTTTPTIAAMATSLRHEDVKPFVSIMAARPATIHDCDAVCDLLSSGFPKLNRKVWRRLFDYPWNHTPPNYGFVLETEGRIVGYLGLLYSQRTINGKSDTVANLTSWYIASNYRGWGGAMLNAALAEAPDITYTALTPAALPRAALKAVGFIETTATSLLLPPLLHARTLRKRPQIIFDLAQIRSHLDADHQRIFDDHRDTSCLHMLVRNDAGAAYLIAKRRLYVRGRASLPASKVLYCSDPGVLAASLEPIKLAILLRQGAIALVVRQNWFDTPPLGLRAESYMLVRSSVFEPHELDTLYSELCILPV